jgi:hypothetical protein
MITEGESVRAGQAKSKLDAVLVDILQTRRLQSNRPLESELVSLSSGFSLVTNHAGRVALIPASRLERYFSGGFIFCEVRNGRR